MFPKCVHAKIIITIAVVYAEWVLIAGLGQRRRLFTSHITPVFLAEITYFLKIKQNWFVINVSTVRTRQNHYHKCRRLRWVFIASLGQRRRCGKIKNSNITCTSRLHSCQQTLGLKWGTRYYSPSVDALRIIPDRSVLHCITSISDLDKKNRIPLWQHQIKKKTTHAHFRQRGGICRVRAEHTHT